METLQLPCGKLFQCFGAFTMRRPFVIPNLCCSLNPNFKGWFKKENKRVFKRVTVLSQGPMSHYHIFAKLGTLHCEGSTKHSKFFASFCIATHQLKHFLQIWTDLDLLEKVQGISRCWANIIFIHRAGGVRHLKKRMHHNHLQMHKRLLQSSMK